MALRLEEAWGIEAQKLDQQDWNTKSQRKVKDGACKTYTTH